MWKSENPVNSGEGRRSDRRFVSLHGFGHDYPIIPKPREQIADAEAFLDIANTMLSSVKSQSASGVSPAEFVNALVNGFGQVPLGIDADETVAPVSIKWKDLGLAVYSTVFVSCGCSTM
ncbi:hypothetical protein Bca52824_000588 [Brassica carinata]|uniref:Non-structural maintenance of chromosomes element 4 n=1 Tax=Brassica carinata TaxID=52824 RepID=A0A8X8BCG7_BRACI|nr:hypothetical protein Bca52824_000588 [Brassica carinata]